MRTHHAVQIAPFNIACLCNCSASVKSIGTMTCIKVMKQEGAILRSLLDTERLQTTKSGILQSGMYDAFQNTYSIKYVCLQAFTAVDTYAHMVYI